MHLKPLKIFCDVVSRRSFSRAADDNQISQSGASQVVHQLEQGLQVKLIDRSRRPLRLTAEGEVFYEGCRKLVQRYLALEEEVRTMKAEVAGRVRVASIYSAGLHQMDRYLKRFLSLYPKANVRLEYLHPHRVYEAVQTDQADLGLVSYPKSTRDIEATPWLEEPMVLVCHPLHRLAGLGRIPIEALDGTKMVGFDRDLTIRREIDRVLQAHHVEVEMVMEFDNIETIKRAVEIDAGVALLPQPTVSGPIDQTALAILPLEKNQLVRPLGIIQRRGKELGVTARRFVELLHGRADTRECEPAGGLSPGGPGQRRQSEQLIGS
ncbi:MAG: LysR family transcriptional regulator [Planctomycetales bacterium]|nr:LysR family transcriptional regulator [Planctomycetales bacterium]